MFVAFEGGEGSGKSTQARMLAEWLREQGRDVLLTREPGGTPLGDRIRALLLDDDEHAPRAEVLLFAADRAQHVATLIRPALERGQIVITDRYIDSSLAYQGAHLGDPAALAIIEQVSLWAVHRLLPDLTILLDVPPATGLARARRRSSADTMERRALDYHAEVRRRFLSLAARDPSRYLVVEGTRPTGEIREDIRTRVTAGLGTNALATLSSARSAT